MARWLLAALATLAWAAPVRSDPERVSRAGFPRGFLWGAATAAYQVEGGNDRSDLWDWEKRRGWEPSGKAADSWRLAGEDVRCLKELGANAYRFSIEWGRVMPEPGRTDESALAYYARLLRLLKAAGIRPVVTIHHFTNPRWFWERHPQGWRDAGAVEDYLAFVRLLADRFGGEVRDWITFNEPMVYLMNGYISGYFPPGERNALGSMPRRLMPAARNIVLAHRKAYRLLHAGTRGPVRVGLSQNITWVEPARGSPRDREAAGRWDHFFHWNLLEAAATGRLDMDLDGKAEAVLDEGGKGLDFVGVNYYTRAYVRDFPALGPVRSFPFHAEVRQGLLGRSLFWLAGGRFGPGPKDDLGHEIYPAGIRLVARAAWDRLRLPVLITENGVADSQDVLRSAYVRDHLRELKRALDEGVPVLGYIHWSLMDNYEWGGFGPKLGLYRVDRSNGFKRELTRGGKTYRDFLRGR